MRSNRYVIRRLCNPLVLGTGGIDSCQQIIDREETRIKAINNWLWFFRKCDFKAFSYYDYVNICGKKLSDANSGKHSIDLLISNKDFDIFWSVRVKTSEVGGLQWLQKAESRVSQGKLNTVPVLIGTAPKKLDHKTCKQILTKLEEDFFWFVPLSGKPCPNHHPIRYDIENTAGRLIDLEAFITAPFGWAHELVMHKRILK